MFCYFSIRCFMAIKYCQLCFKTRSINIACHSIMRCDSELTRRFAVARNSGKLKSLKRITMNEYRQICAKIQYNLPKCIWCKRQMCFSRKIGYVSIECGQRHMTLPYRKAHLLIKGLFVIRYNKINLDYEISLKLCLYTFVY